MITLSTTIFTLLPTLLLLLRVPTITSAAAPLSLINQTCKNSSESDPNIDFNFCITSFRISRSSGQANLTRLGLISLNTLKHYVVNTTYLIKGLLENKEKDEKGTKAGLKDCLELYSDSISTAREAARDYRAKRMNDANVKISAVMDDSSTCEDGFHDVGVYSSPLTLQNNSTFQLSVIALSIMNVLPPL